MSENELDVRPASVPPEVEAIAYRRGLRDAARQIIYLLEDLSESRRQLRRGTTATESSLRSALLIVADEIRAAFAVRGE